MIYFTRATKIRMPLRKVQSNDEKQFQKLLKNYYCEVNIVVMKMEEFFDIKNLSDWRCNKIPRVGSLGDNALTYRFHGTGCSVRTPDICLDFEFGINGVVGGFDAWRIWKFIKNANIEATCLHVNKSLEDIDLILKELVEFEVLVFDGNLFWLK